MMTTLKPKQACKQSSIPFYPHLINELKQEHHILKQHLWFIQNALGEKNYVDAEAAIQMYRSIGLMHSTKENIKIYAYLRLVYSEEDPPIESVKLRAIRKIVDLTLITMFDFCEEYGKDLATNARKQETVHSAFHTASKLFLEKIKLEENTIYPLYLRNPK